MTTKEVANELVQLCREGKFEQVITELYSPQIISKEPEGGQWGEVQGLAAIRKKGEEWQAMVDEVISSEISDPIVAADHFSIAMKSRVRMKGMNEPMDMDEICVYKVSNGKVVVEEFFYTPLAEPV